MDQVDFISGKTRLYGIVGDPIAQVRSPEMVTFELQSRGLDAVLLPLHVLQADFDEVLPRLLQIHNLDGLIFTIPYKVRAMHLADEVGPQAQVVGALNALARDAQGRWHADIFDGTGCVEAFRRRGYALAGQRLMLMGLGGAGAAIAAALASEKPRAMRLFDLDTARAEALASQLRRLSPATEITVGPPGIDDIDVLLNATPVGMLGDTRMAIEVQPFPEQLIVFDAIVMPEQTPLLAHAERHGCRTVRGREMMRGQIAKIVDFFIATRRGAT